MCLDFLNCSPFERSKFENFRGVGQMKGVKGFRVDFYKI
jgi:hypothetical protein